MKEETLLIVVISVLCVLVIALFIIQGNSGIADYNGGTCKVCGGHYEYQQTIGHAYTTEYIYICNSCGNMVRTGTYLGK